MAAPAVQIYCNAGKMKIFIDFITDYIAYNLYWDTDPAMGAEALVGRTSNVVDGQYSRAHVLYPFTRPVSEDTVFYLRLKGILPSGVEDVGNPGPIKYIPSVSENLPLYKPVIIEGFDGTVYRPVKVNTDGEIVTA